MTTTFLLIFAGALTLAIGGTPLVRRVALRLGMIDQPAARKIHVDPKPLLGGVAIYGAFIAALLLFGNRFRLQELVSILIGVFEPSFQLTPTWPAHGWLLALALGSQVIGWLLIAIALPRLAALETSVLLLLQPALTVLWANLIFSEHLSNLQWVGVLLVLGGVAVVSMRGSVNVKGD